MNIPALIAAAACIDCQIPAGMRLSVLIYLANQILETSGGGGSGCFQCSSGVVPPVAPPTNADQPAQYTDTAAGFTYYWSIPMQAWVPVPKVYRALLSQTGTDDPVVIVLANGLGGTVVWTRSIAGQYVAALAGAFPAAKTLCFGGSLEVPGDYSFFNRFNRNSDNEVYVITSADGTASDGLLSGTSVEILVYP